MDEVREFNFYIVKEQLFGLGPEIWLEYSQYAIRYIGKEGGFEKVIPVTSNIH